MSGPTSGIDRLVTRADLKALESRLTRAAALATIILTSGLVVGLIGWVLP